MSSRNSSNPSNPSNFVETGRMTLRLGSLALRINYLIALCVLMAFALFMNLGLWQLGRAAEKRQLQREYALQQQETPVPLNSLAAQTTGQAAGDAALNNRRVTLQGTYLNETSFVLVYQFFQGLPGNEIITPFRQLDGTLVLISRGWMPPAGEQPVPDIPLVTGPRQITGQLHVTPADTAADQAGGQADLDSWPVRLRRLQVGQAEQLLGEAVYPWVVRLDSEAPGVLVRHWPAVTVSTRSNIGYALQWFGLAVATLVISLLLSSNLLQLLRNRRSAS